MGLLNLALGLVALQPSPALSTICLQWSRYEVENDKVWFLSSKHRETRRLLHGVDAKAFRVLTPIPSIGSCAAGYAADGQRAFYEGEQIPGVHAPSFRVFGFWYAKDRNRAYGEGKPISVEVASFREIGGGYAADGRAGFYGGSKLRGTQFKGMNVYAKSEVAVFYEGKVLAGIDAVTFEELPERPTYGRDARNVVYEGKRIMGADSASFEIIAPTVIHARDRFRVYYRGEVIAGADSKTIQQIENYYFRDRRAVYVEGKEIPGADPATFRVTGEGIYAEDKNRVYKIGQPIYCKGDAGTLSACK